MSRLLSRMVLVMVAFAGLAGCRDRDDAGRLRVAEATDAGVLLYNNGAEPRGLDPQTVTGVPEIRVLQSLFEGLFAYGELEGTDPQPGVAHRWELADDERTWTFHLRPDARWNNGDRVTAHDFVFAWRRAMTPELGCEYADWFYMIEGGEAFHRGEAPFEAVGLRAVDDLTLEMRLAAPTANIYEILLHHTFLPVHPPTVLAAGDAAQRNSGWARMGSFVGNGPFQLAEWRPHVRLRVERNPHYWDAENVRLNGIHFFPIDDEQTSLRAFESGLAHLTSAVPVNWRGHYRKHSPERIRFDDYAGVYFFRINIHRPGLDDARVRRALALAIDRQTIVTQITRGGERPAWGYTPPGIEGYTPPGDLRFDPAEARRLLAAAGYPEGRGLPAFDLLFNTSDNHRTIAEAVQQMWREHLGVEVRLANMEWRTYLDTTHNLNYDIARAGWIGNNYVNAFLRNYQSISPNNQTGYSDPTYDRLILEARQTLDRERRLELAREAEERLLDAMPVIPVYWYKNVFLIHPHVRNWNPKLYDLRPYQKVWLQAAGAQ